MRKVILLSVFFIAVAFSAQAQDDSYNATSRRAQLSKDSMNVETMVIPCNSKLYNSFYDKQMTQANDLTFHQLRDTILKSLSDQICLAINDSLTAGVIPESKSGYQEDMQFVYESITYSYELVPEPKKEATSVDKFKNKFKKKDPKPEPRKGTYMENGQIVSNAETRPRFTNVKIVNPDFLFLLEHRYHANTFVFVNQYEMVIPTTVSQIDIQGDNYPREIRVHYTIVDASGKELDSGIVIHNSSSFDNELKYLINNSFVQIGQQIAQKLLEVR